MKKKNEKLSAIIIKMAEFILAHPVNKTSDAGVHAALLLAHVAWNQEVDFERSDTKKGYLKLLAIFEEENSSFRAELKSFDCEKLIAILRQFKQKHYPEDRRFIHICGINEKGNVQVAWD